MQTNRFQHTSLKRQHWLLRVTAALGAAFLYIPALVMSTPVTHADGIPGGNVSDPVVRAVDIAKPAVVRIFTILGGQLTVHFSATQSATFPLNGST